MIQSCRLSNFSALVITVFLGVWPALAEHLTVTTLADGGPGSLRDAITNAASGDTINFSVTGTITLSSTLTISNNLTISGPGASSLAISGNNAVQVFFINPGVTAGISGLTVQKGSGTLGGGIYNGGTLTLTNGTVSGNSAGSGGGIANTGTLSLTNSTVSGNNSGGRGGGISNYGTLTAANSTISGNYAICNITGCGGVGGAIDNALHSTLTLTNSTVSGNSVAGPGGVVLGLGGGIYNEASTATLINSTVSGNSASQGGGITNTIAGHPGDYPAMNLVNSTVAGNSGSPGGIYAPSQGLVALKNSILANDMGGIGNCYLSPFPPSPTGLSQGHNLSDDSSCSAFLTAAGDLNSTPAGLDPSGLQNNGGPTKTIALLPTSPAVDAIPVSPVNYCTAADGATPIATDQRGLSRPQGSACEIGAFERQIQGCLDHTIHGHIVTTPPDGHDADSHAHHAQHGHNLLPGVDCLPAGHHVTVNGHILGLTPESSDGAIPSALTPKPDFVAALNQDGLNAPAARGTIVQLFGSAGGLFLDQTDLRPALGFTPPASGSALYYTESLPEVQIGGVKADVLFSGLAPGLKGVWQINVRIPDGVSPGNLAVTIAYDGAALTSADVAVE